MAAGKNYKAMVKKLKKQLSASRRKEKSSRNQLKNALAKMRKTDRTHGKKIEQHKKAAKSKLATSESTIYLKLANFLKGKAKKSGARKAKSRTVTTVKVTRRSSSARGGKRKSR